MTDKFPLRSIFRRGYVRFRDKPRRKYIITNSCSYATIIEYSPAEEVSQERLTKIKHNHSGAPPQISCYLNKVKPNNYYDNGNPLSFSRADFKPDMSFLFDMRVSYYRYRK